MFVSMMKLILFVTTILPCLCLGAGVELTASPSLGTEGGSLILTCSMTANNSTSASFYNDSNAIIGYVKIQEGTCKDAKKQGCNQLCSCNTDGTSFSWTISSVTTSLETTRVRCEVYNPTSTYSDFLDIDLNNAPKNKTLYIAYPSVVYEGDDVNLDCGIERGNPLATLSWTCVDQSKETSSDADNGGTNRHYSRLRIRSITRDYNGRQCVCTATHPRLAQNLTRSAVITVYFPPSVPVLTVDTTNGNTLPWLDRLEFTGILLCTMTDGNPSTSHISWNNGGWQPWNQATRTRRFSPPNKYDNGRTFTCWAHNNFTITKGIIRRSSGMMLNVEYDPVITLVTSTAYISEGSDFTRTCSAVGNPSPEVYWFHNSKLLMTQQRTLRFNRTDRQNAGNYTCIATARYTGGNITLQSTKSFSIVVRYAPDVGLTIANTTENATNVRLNCTANGVPDQFTYKWRHMFGSTVIRDSFDHVTSSGSISTLTIPRVTYQDMGTYICEVGNGYRGRDGQIVQTRQGVLSVKGSPRAIGAQDRYVTENGISLDINITYISFPEPVSTSILRVDSALPPQSELSIDVSSVPVTVQFYNIDVSVDGYMVHLHFSKFETKHRGHYQLHVRNGFDYNYKFEIVISVTCRTYSGGLQAEVTLNHTTSSFTVADLDIATNYDVTVYASNVKGTSETITSTFRTTAGNTEIVVESQANNTDIGVVLIFVASVMILLSLLIVAVFTLRTGRFPCRRNTTESVRQGEPPRDVPHPENDQHGQQQYEDINLEQVGIPAVYDVVTDNEAWRPGENRQQYEELSLEQVGIPAVYDVVADNADGMPGENRQQYEELSLEQVGIPSVYDVVADNEGGMPGENRQQYEELSLEQVGIPAVYDVVAGTVENSDYVNTSLH